MSCVDLPDYTKAIAVNIEVAPILPLYVIPKPKGGVLKKGSITITNTYQTVASHIVTNGKTFQLSKVMVSASKAAWIRYRWNGTVISAERNLDDKTIMLEHFPYDYYVMVGNGTKTFDVQAKYDEEAGTVNVEITGEEED